MNIVNLIGNTLAALLCLYVAPSSTGWRRYLMTAMGGLNAGIAIGEFARLVA